MKDSATSSRTQRQRKSLFLPDLSRHNNALVVASRNSFRLEARAARAIKYPSTRGHLAFSACVQARVEYNSTRSTTRRAAPEK